MISIFPAKQQTENAEPRSSSPSTQLRNAVVFGGGLMGGGTMIYATLDLIKSEPDKAFRLLQEWGPWFFLAMFCAWAANGFLLRGLQVAERIGDRFADSVDKLADEQKRLANSQEDMAASAKVQAEAARQTADKDDREAERMQTLVEYSASQSRQALESSQANNKLLQQIADHIYANKNT